MSRPAELVELTIAYGCAERASGAAAWSGSHEEYAEAADRAAEALTPGC